MANNEIKSATATRIGEPASDRSVYLAEILLHICRRERGKTLSVTEGEAVEYLYCRRCNRELEAGQKSVAVYMFAQTVGVRPRQKPSAQRICFGS